MVLESLKIFCDKYSSDHVSDYFLLLLLLLLFAFVFVVLVLSYYCWDNRFHPLNAFYLNKYFTSIKDEIFFINKKGVEKELAECIVIAVALHAFRTRIFINIYERKKKIFTFLYLSQKCEMCVHFFITFATIKVSFQRPGKVHVLLISIKFSADFRISVRPSVCLSFCIMSMVNTLLFTRRSYQFQICQKH